jgi:hypothetical protein
MNRRSVTSLLLGLSCLPAALGWMVGCTTVHFPRDRSQAISTGQGPTHQGLAHQGLGHSDSVALAGDSAAQGWEIARRDPSMNVRAEPSAWDQAAWPEPERASLDDYRRLYLSDRPGTIDFPSQRTDYPRRGVYFVRRTWE